MTAERVSAMFPLVGPFRPGMVCLVGAGPGDPSLITVKGAVRLAQADVVLRDRLIDATLLRMCGDQARLIPVGKRRGRHSLPQKQINEMMLNEARAGRRVVRLKGGDPFVFSRGGEECEFLSAHSIPFEIVPGVTAATAAAAYAGFPLTHRDWASCVALVSGHQNPTHMKSAPDFAALAGMGTVAFYMGVRELRANCERLVRAGMPPSTPAAVIVRGTWPGQRTVVGTLADIAERATEANVAAPAMTVIGDVVSLREKLRWYDVGPLSGRTVLVTRPKERAAELTALLVQAGATVLEAPTIRIEPVTDAATLDRVVRRLSDYDWIVLTSAIGVDALLVHVRRLGMDARGFGGARIAAIGPVTADRLKGYSLQADLVSAAFTTESLGQTLIETGIRGRRILLLRSGIAREELRETLEQAGAVCEEVPVYRTRHANRLPKGVTTALREKRVSWITLTSSSTFSSLIKLLGEQARELLDGVKLAAIGPVTARTIRASGYPVHVQAEPHTCGGLVDALIAHESAGASG